MYLVDQKVSATGKKTGHGLTKQAPVTVELWEQHLSGVQRLGVVPIRDDNTVVFGALDIDSYKDFDVAALSKKVAALGLPLVVCKSKSGGAHLYCFAKEPVQAVLMIARLREMLTLLGLPQMTEVFPKQAIMDAERGDLGSWLNMPYFEGTRTMVYAILGDGRGLSASEFLDVAGLTEQGHEFFTGSVTAGSSNDYFPDAPPCLQRLALTKMSEGGRNNGFVSVCVYLKRAFPDDWKERARTYGALFFDPPLPLDEIVTTIGSVTRRGTYRYGCQKEPLKAVCDSAVCRTRKYGVGRGGGGGEMTEDNQEIPQFPTLGQLRKLLTEPPMWFMDVNDIPVRFSTDELVTPRLFQKRLVETINVCPPQPTATAWQRIIQEKMDTVLEMEAPEDTSPGGRLWVHMEHFCTREPADKKDDVTSGQIYNESGFTWFRFLKFKDFLERAHFKDLEDHEIFAELRERGAKTTTWKLSNKLVRVWGVPKFQETEMRPEDSSGPPM